MKRNNWMDGCVLVIITLSHSV